MADTTKKEVWKHQLLLPRSGPQLKRLPQGAKLLHAEIEGSTIWFWEEHFVVNRNKPVNRYLEVYGTGDPNIKGHGIHFATLLQHGFVWHVYDLQGRPN